MTRLLFLESQPAIRCGLRMRFRVEPDLVVAGEAADGLAALSQASALRPDVVVVDIDSTGMDAVELIRAVRLVSSRSAVVALSFRDDPATRKRLQAAGATAFVSKHECADRLIQAIREVTGGEAERAPAPSRMRMRQGLI